MKINLLLDPVGTSSPDLPTKERYQTMDGVEKSSVTILCSAQASPPPAYR